MAEIDLEPLTSPIIEATLPSESVSSKDFTFMNLCFLKDETDSKCDQLVIQSESSGAAGEEYLTKVKPINGNATIEVEKQYIKVWTEWE